jgi:hypothetical protein
MQSFYPVLAEFSKSLLRCLVSKFHYSDENAQLVIALLAWIEDTHFGIFK